MKTTLNDNHVAQYQSSVWNKPNNIDENQIKELYNLGFHNGRDEFMSDSQLNMVILPIEKLRNIDEVEKNEEI